MLFSYIKTNTYTHKEISMFSSYFKDYESLYLDCFHNANIIFECKHVYYVRKENMIEKRQSIQKYRTKK